MYGTARIAHLVVGLVMEKERETLPGLVNVLGDALMVKPVELRGGQVSLSVPGPHPCTRFVHTPLTGTEPDGQSVGGQV